MKYDLDVLTDFICDFAKARAEMNEDWQDHLDDNDLDDAVRKLFPGISSDQLKGAKVVVEVAEFIYAFAKAKAGISEKWQGEVDARVRNLFPDIGNDQLEEANQLADDRIIADMALGKWRIKERR
jgi:hypothetical protein